MSLEGNRAILEGHPAVDRFIGLTKRDGWALIKTFLSLRQENYDLALAFHANTSLCRWLFLTGAKQKVAHHHSWTHTPRCSSLNLDKPGVMQNAIEKDFEILKALGWKNAPLPSQLTISEEEADKAEATLLSRGVFKERQRVVFLPGAAEALRRYPKELATQMLLRLRKTDQFELAILSDGELAREWNMEAWSHEIGVPLITDLSLKDFIAVLSRFHLAIANDSGPGHIAAALGLKTVHIFGKGSIGDFYPYDLVRHRFVRTDVDCRVHGPRDNDRFQFCTVETCSHLSCLRKISPEEIAESSLALAEIS